MTDRWLWVAWPYVALASVVVIPAARVLAAPHPLRSIRSRLRTSDARGWSAVLWRTGVACVAAGHALILLWPGRVLEWNRSPARLVALEAVLFAGGCAAAGAFVAFVAARGRSRRARFASLMDSILLSQLALAIASGLSMAVMYRWASSWSAVTLAPYLASLIAFDPDPRIAAGMPFLVRLHVVSALAFITLVPLRLALLVELVGALVGARPEQMTHSG